VGGGVGPIRAPNQVLYQLHAYAIAAWALIPFAIVGVATVRSLRKIGPYEYALGWALLLLTVTYTDVGAGFNQLLDVTTLTVIVVGLFAARLRTREGIVDAVALLLAISVVWAAGTNVVLTQVPDIRATVEHQPLGYPLRPLAGLVRSGQRILSEDPYVPLSMGQKPVVLDPFMLLRLDRADPSAVDHLIGWIEQQRFAYIVMITSLASRNDYWFNQFHFGPRVVAAMRDAYVLQGKIDDYFVYHPAR
jgi:hypothetical protein